MNETKPTLSSKTLLTNFGLAILNVLVLFGVINSDMGLSDAAHVGGVVGVVNVIGNLVSVYFRKRATAKLV